MSNRYISVPDEYLYEGFERRTLGAPRGLEDSIQPLELLRNNDANEWWVLCELTEEDKERGKVWFVILGDKFPPVSAATAYKKDELLDGGK